MAQTKTSTITTSEISGVNYSDMSVSGNATDFFSIASQDVDSANGDETSWTPQFSRWNGYYKSTSDFQSIIDKVKSWVLGGGFEDSTDLKKTEKINGWGKDDFLEICKNQLRVCMIAGDSFAEIIKDKKGRLINLKPLNAGTIKIIVDGKGRIKRYEQTIKGETEKFKLDEIFHLSWKRIADEIHGIPLGECIESLILIRNETMFDQKIFFHRYVIPIMMIPIDEDNETEVTRIKAKYLNSYKKGEVMFVGKDVIDTKNIKNALGDLPSISPLPYMEYIDKKLTTGSDVPELIMGWSKGVTEAGGKMVMIGWELSVKEKQKWLETQYKMQLKLDLKIVPPPTINPESPGSSDATVDSSISDAKKDGDKIGITPGKNT